MFMINLTYATPRYAMLAWELFQDFNRFGIRPTIMASRGDMKLIERFSKEGCPIRQVEPIDVKWPTLCRVPYELTKVRAWNLDREDEQVCLLDADYRLLRDPREMMDIFTPHWDYLVAPSGGDIAPLCSACLIFYPDECVYQDLLDVILNPGEPHGPAWTTCGWQNHGPIEWPHGWDFYGGRVSQGLLYYWYHVQRKMWVKGDEYFPHYLKHLSTDATSSMDLPNTREEFFDRIQRTPVR